MNCRWMINVNIFKIIYGHLLFQDEHKAYEDVSIKNCDNQKHIDDNPAKLFFFKTNYQTVLVKIATYGSSFIRLTLRL